MCVWKLIVGIVAIISSFYQSPQKNILKDGQTIHRRQEIQKKTDGKKRKRNEADKNYGKKREKNRTLRLERTANFKSKTKMTKTNLDWRQENEGIRKRKNGVNTHNNGDRQRVGKGKVQTLFPLFFQPVLHFHSCTEQTHINTRTFHSVF